ncbi:hypothetical protein [Georgenia muralis]
MDMKHNEQVIHDYVGGQANRITAYFEQRGFAIVPGTAHFAAKLSTGVLFTVSFVFMALIGTVIVGFEDGHVGRMLIAMFTGVTAGGFLTMWARSGCWTRSSPPTWRSSRQSAMPTTVPARTRAPSTPRVSEPCCWRQPGERTDLLARQRGWTGTYNDQGAWAARTGAATGSARVPIATSLLDEQPRDR